MHQKSSKTLIRSLPWQIIGIQMITECVRKQFLHSVIHRIITKYISSMRPDLSRAFSFRFVGTSRLSTQRSRKNFLLILLVQELDALALLFANAECQQKAIAQFLMLMLLVKGVGKNVTLLTGNSKWTDCKL